MEIEVSDADLARRIGWMRDAEAEAELCGRMGPRIRLYGLRHLRNADAADDLVQHVLVTVIQALRAGKLQDGEKLASFVLGTCRMSVLETRRNTQRRERLLGEFGQQTTQWVAPKLPDLDGQRLAGCVQRLRERERSIIMLTFYDEQTAAGVGRFLGLTEANVRVIRYRAMQQLRGCMGAFV